MVFDFAKLGEVVRQVVPFLDRVIDINYYPTVEAEFSNHKWRPVGLGLMGLQDVFFKKGLAFDSADAKELSRTISAHIYFHALWASTELAEVNGPHEAFEGTRAAKGDLQFDLWDRNGRDGRASRRRPNSTGTRCGPASPSTACATAC